MAPPDGAPDVEQAEEVSLLDHQPDDGAPEHTAPDDRVPDGEQAKEDEFCHHQPDDDSNVRHRGLFCPGTIAFASMPIQQQILYLIMLSTMSHCCWRCREPHTEEPHESSPTISVQTGRIDARYNGLAWLPTSTAVR